MAATTFEELWTELKTDAAEAIEAVGEKLHEIEENIVPTLEADIVLVLGQLKQLAIDTVMQLAGAEFNQLTGREKQGRVVTTVFQAAEAAGKNIAFTDAQMFGQQAYNAVKTSLPQPGT